MGGKLWKLYILDSMAQMPPGYSHGGGKATGTLQVAISSASFNMKTRWFWELGLNGYNYAQKLW